MHNPGIGGRQPWALEAPGHVPWQRDGVACPEQGSHVCRPPGPRPINPMRPAAGTQAFLCREYSAQSLMHPAQLTEKTEITPGLSSGGI